MKFPFLQLFCGDYLSDPKLSLCSASTRGVWMDFLCVMHMNDRCGVITGTREQLARLGRCSAVEVSHAIDELQRTETADVTERNSVVTVNCRRMKREAEARKQGRLRVQRHRESESVTEEETRKPLLVMEYGSDSTPTNGECEGKPKPAEAPELIYAEYPKKAARPDAIRAIVKAIKKVGFCELLAKTRAYALAVQGEDFQFVPYPESWFNAERYNDDPETWKRTPISRPASSRPPTITELKTQRDTLEGQLNTIRNKHGTGPLAKQWSDADKATRDDLKRRINELNDRMAKAAQ